MIESKFTTAEVAALHKFQTEHRFHPFTCPNRDDGNHFDNGIDLGGLIPTVRGWICQCCDYEQDWAHPFMKETPPQRAKDYGGECGECAG